VTWGSEPQTPWSQQTEKNNLIILLSLEPVFVPNMYTPQGVSLYYLVLLLFNFCLVSYKADGQLPVLLSQVEESIFVGMLPFQVFKLLEKNFYITSSVNIKLAHLENLKCTYGLTDEQMSKSHELDDSFV
jgi:hypothetical protein